MAENAKTHPITIDLSQFKLHIDLKKKIELTLNFNSPSRRFYLSVIAFVVNEMKRQGKLTSIPLEGHHDLLALLNDTVGGSAGLSDNEHLLPRIYRKWQHALPDLEGAPLFTVLGKKKGYEEGVGKTYHFTEAQKDSWANLFEYKGSEENVRLKFAVDRLGAGLDDVAILYEGTINGDAWERFISSLRDRGVVKPEKEKTNEVHQEPAAQVSSPTKWKIPWPTQHRRALLIVAIGLVAGASIAIWMSYFRYAPQPDMTAKEKKVSLPQEKSLAVEPPSKDVSSEAPPSAKAVSKTVDKTVLPLPDLPSIAVLPFANMSGDPKQEFLSDGITESIITSLSKLPRLLVIARTSTFAYKGTSARVDQVAKELGVHYVLEGSVRKMDEKIRITAQLIDAATGHHLWAERYEGNLRDVFALEDQITDKIVAVLAVKLTEEEKGRVAQKGTENVAAYEEFLKGWEHYLRFTSDDLAKAVVSFKKAIELDPNYGQAYAALALTYWSGSNIGVVSKGLGVPYLEARLLPRKYLREAMKKPTSIAYLINSQYHLYRRQHEEAISDLQQALVLDPGNPRCNALMGSALFLSGKPREAINFIHRAMRLDPHNKARYLYLLGGAQFCMGNLDESVAFVEKAIKLNPEITGAAGWLVASYGLLGREKEAHAALDILRKGKVDEPNIQQTMYFFPFKDRVVADRFAEGLSKAGIKGRAGGYFPAFKENRLTGEEVKRLLFGTKATGPSRIDVDDSEHWRVTWEKNGDFTVQGPGPISSDTGKSWIEGEMICLQYQKRYSGLEICSTVFKNPKGIYEAKDEYFFCRDVGFAPFSLVR